jgi:hypothetical protein
MIMNAYGVRLATRIAGGLVGLLWMACAASPAHASSLNPLEIALVEYGRGTYFEPVGRNLVIRYQPARLFIRIRNTSESAVMVRVRPEMAYSLELTDESGKTSTVSRKKMAGEDMGDDTRVSLAAGADRIVPMEIRPDTWDGVPEVTAGAERKFTVRIVYESADRRHLTSEPYTVIFRLQQ